MFNHFEGDATEEEELFNLLRSANLSNLPESDYESDTDSNRSMTQFRQEGMD